MRPYTTREVAEKLGVTVDHVRVLAKQGKFGTYHKLSDAKSGRLRLNRNAVDRYWRQREAEKRLTVDDAIRLVMAAV